MKNRMAGALRAILMATVVGASLVTMAGLPCVAQAQTRALPDFTDLVEAVGPSVVNIRTLEKVVPRGAIGGPGDEDMFEFFRRFGFPVPDAPRQAPKKGAVPSLPPENQPKGVASGFILSDDGLIMTNAHVVEGADQVIVTLTDKREFKAHIVGVDKRTDVAIVQIEATGLPAVKIGDVGKLRVGEWVMAIGSPFGLENTVTAGIVSAKQRDTGEYLPFIQTDVAINPGNSGGPLLNMRGEVVGMNSQIYSRSGGFMGISFAIPIDEAIRVSDQLRANGRVSRGRIGVKIDQVSKDVAESLGLGSATGALVVSVEPQSPAAKAGVEAGDIITRFDGKPIARASDLPRIVGAVKPGSKSTMTVLRRGAERELSVVATELDVDKSEKRADKSGSSEQKPKVSAVTQVYGLTVSALTEAQKKELDVKAGVRIDSVADAAVRAGLNEGDVILAVANKEVGSVAEFETILLKQNRSKPVLVLYRRGDMTSYAVLRSAN